MHYEILYDCKRLFLSISSQELHVTIKITKTKMYLLYTEKVIGGKKLQNYKVIEWKIVWKYNQKFVCISYQEFIFSISFLQFVLFCLLLLHSIDFAFSPQVTRATRQISNQFKTHHMSNTRRQCSVHKKSWRSSAINRSPGGFCMGMQCQRSAMDHVIETLKNSDWSVILYPKCCSKLLLFEFMHMMPIT